MKNYTTLSALVSPGSAEVFFHTYWNKKFFLNQQGSKELSELFNYQKLAIILNAQAYSLQMPDIRMTMDGQHLEPDEIMESGNYFVVTGKGKKVKISPYKVKNHLKNGASLILNDAHEYDLGLQSFAHTLSREMKLPVSVTVFHSSKGKETFKPHFDPIDVFVIQLEGEKDWVIDGYTANPTMHRDEKDFSPRKKAPAKKFRMRPGDVLYMPSGVWHSAAAASDNSLSLNVSFPYMRKIDLAYAIIGKYLIPNLLNDETLREYMPLPGLGSDRSYASKLRETKNRIQGDIKSLLSEFDDTDLASIMDSLNLFDMNRGMTSSFDNRISFIADKLTK